MVRARFSMRGWQEMTYNFKEAEKAEAARVQSVARTFTALEFAKIILAQDVTGAIENPAFFVKASFRLVDAFLADEATE